MHSQPMTSSDILIAIGIFSCLTLLAWLIAAKGERKPPIDLGRLDTMIDIYYAFERIESGQTNKLQLGTHTSTDEKPETVLIPRRFITRQTQFHLTTIIHHLERSGQWKNRATFISDPKLLEALEDRWAVLHGKVRTL